MSICKSTFERAVIDIAEDVNKRSKTKRWQQRDESQLWYELVACLLGSRVSFELAQASAKSLDSSGVLDRAFISRVNHGYSDMVFSVLSKPVWIKTYRGFKRQTKYRFPKSRADGIAKTAKKIYHSPEHSIRNILGQSSDSRDARKNIVEISHGIGAKQASLFLRNIGYSNDLAILDSHILRYMHVVCITEKLLTSVSNIRTYERIESDLCKYADGLGFQLSCLDTAIWIVMRVYQKEFVN